MKVIGVTGLPGSGKGVVSRVARSLKIPVVKMGDVIRDEAKKRNLTTGEVAVKLREEYGEFVVAERCIETIKRLDERKSGRGEPSRRGKSYKRGGRGERVSSKLKGADHGVYVIEGIRSPYEVEMFKKNFEDFRVIAVYSSPHTRFKRIQKRNRSDDSARMSEFRNRDKRELKFGIGDVIATADYMVVNEGSLKKFKSVVRSILKNEMQDDSKG